MRAKAISVWCLGLLLAVPSLGAAADSKLADAAKQQDKAAVRTLLKQGASVSAPQPDGATALHWAAHWNDVEMADLLLKAKANVNAKNDYDVTPLTLATENGSEAMVLKLLKAGANPNAATSTGETPLMTAVHSGNITVVKALIASGAEVNLKGGGREQSPLLWAVGGGQHEIMRVLLENGAKVDDASEMRRNFVSFSRGNPQGGRLTGIADHTLESDGTRPGLRWVNRGGLTPLILAAKNGDLDSIKILLAAGSNINAVDGLGSTALMVAIRNDQFETAAFLLDKGADPNIDTAGHVALHIAVARKNIETVKALIAHKANVNVRLVKGEPDPEGNRRFNQLPEFVAGATPFLLAAGLNDLPTMKLLVAAGADAKIPMIDGTTSTMASMGIFPGVFTFIPFVKVPPRGAAGDNTAYFQRAKLFKEKTVLDCLKYTVEQGVDVNAARGQLTTYHVGNSRTLVGRDVGDTALHMATADKYPTVVEYLVSKGARMDVKDKRGLTPLAMAKSSKRQFITGGDNGEIIGDPGMVAVLTKLGAPE